MKENDRILYHVFQNFHQDDKLMEAYEARRKWQMDQASLLDDAREEGIEKGRKETIQKVLSQGFSLESIQKIYSLSKEELEFMRKTGK